MSFVRHRRSRVGCWLTIDSTSYRSQACSSTRAGRLLHPGSSCSHLTEMEERVSVESIRYVFRVLTLAPAFVSAEECAIKVRPAEL